MQTGDLIAFITYAMVIIMGCLIMGMVSIMLPRADVAAQRLSEVLATEPTVRDPEAPTRVRSDAAAGVRITFDDVSFRYTDDGDPALSHVSFTAEPGTTLAIVGPTGSGISTIVKLIERFYDPTEGSVTLDGADLRALSQADLRACFGYVPQKAFLFEGTVKQHRLRRRERRQAAIRAAEVACAWISWKRARRPFRSHCPGGDNVSRPAPAAFHGRALVRRPRAYLFDDCFSALDYATDARVRAALPAWAAGSTVILVAQRISTVLAADRIVVLDEGRVAGVGTHAELMESCPEYREIALSQLSEEELAEGGAR
ncbi:MAG: ABC transporter ATP-binding protein [Adlercreutzia sp.]